MKHDDFQCPLDTSYSKACGIRPWSASSKQTPKHWELKQTLRGGPVLTVWVTEFAPSTWTCRDDSFSGSRSRVVPCRI